MGKDLRKLDIQALTASSGAADKLFDFLQNIREDVVTAITGTLTVYHKGIADHHKIKSANSSSLATSITLANELRTAMNLHLASTGHQGVHMAASATAITAAVASSLATGITLAAEMKADFNTHLTESGVHMLNDSTNTVTAAHSITLQAELDTLLNDIKTKMNLHRLGTMSAGFIAAR
jgi:hypothetical protein